MLPKIKQDKAWVLMASPSSVALVWFIGFKWSFSHIAVGFSWSLELRPILGAFLAPFQAGGHSRKVACSELNLLASL